MPDTKMDSLSRHLEAAAPSFANLTPVCLTLVFSNLSLPDSLSCSQVNRHWRTEVIAYCQIHVRSIQISTLKPSPPFIPFDAHLLTNEDGSRMYPDPPQERFYSLILGESPFPISLGNTLAHFSPHLTKLDVHLRKLNDDNLFGFLALLSQSPSLVSLALSVCRIKFPIQIKRGRLHHLFNIINSLGKLEHLKLRFYYHSLGMKPNLPCLARLHSLDFECTDRWDILRHSLLKHAAAANCRLQRIEYQTERSYLDENAEAMLRYSNSVQGRSVASRFTQFPFAPRIYIPAEHIPSLVPLLPSVTALRVEIEYSEWHSTMRALARLHNLCRLNVETWLREEDEPLQSDPIVAFPRLSSVHTFHLVGHYRTSHPQLAEFDLFHFFPRLQVLGILLAPFPGKICEQCAPGRCPSAQSARAMVADWKTSQTLKHASIESQVIDLAMAFADV